MNLVAPFNATEEERKAWFREQLHHFKILKSNNLTQQFDARVLGFLGRDCEAQFFMTWISPAGLFGGRELVILKPLHDHGFKVQSMDPDLSFLVKGTPAES
ncbi:hypothetical protein ACSQ67_020464 [Phaseolus vulgaris]